ncbi:MAG TPA: carbon monoxide dehydrogenase subunit G [Luteitalea sp.]|nr:carbon monoxide dehydrogenase subunit G [Luteitalea sp.]
MDIVGSYTFDAPRAKVWALLMDPAVIASCIPGCDAFEPVGDNTYRARMTVALAAITGTYDGDVTLTDLVPERSYRLLAEGKGRPGFVKGSAAITLRDDGAGTIVDVNGTVQTGGPIARLGQRLIGGVSKLMMDRFFAAMAEKSRA